MIRRTPPHLSNQHNRKHLNMKESASSSHPIGNSSINDTKTSDENYDHFASRPISFGGSSSLPQNHSIYTGIVAEEGETQGYMYLPMLSSTTLKTSGSLSSTYKQGTPRANGNPSKNLRSSIGGSKSGGSNSRTADYQLPHQLSSFYPVAPQTNGNNWNHFQHQRLPQYHYNQPGREHQTPLTSYLSSQNTSSSSSSNTASTGPTSSSVLGKRPAASNPAKSFFHTPPPLDADDMGPQCSLETDELLGLVQSLGTPEFLSNSEKVFRSGSSLYEPRRSASSLARAGGGSAVSAPSLGLGLENGGSDDKGKGKEVGSYWDLSAMAETMESMKKQRLEAGQSLPELTLGSDAQGCSKNNLQRCPWN